jgi:hypothetical protein
MDFGKLVRFFGRLLSVSNQFRVLLFKKNSQSKITFK